MVDFAGKVDALASILAEDPVDVLCIGRGSNLLVSERGFEGVAVVLGPAKNAFQVQDRQ